VFHHKDPRIQAHVQLCWLALLLLRVAEVETDQTWRNIRDFTDRPRRCSGRSAWLPVKASRAG
jgi:hypothetical protein